MELSVIVEILLGLSAVIVALRNIYSFITRPKKIMKEYQQKQHEELVNTIKEVIREEMKEMQCGMDYHDGIIRLILATQIERIYWAGFKDKTLYLYNQEPLHTLYEAYHNLGGNGHITNLMEQMKNWKITDTSDVDS